MKNLFLLYIILVLSPIAMGQKYTEKNNWNTIFKDANVNGCMLLYNTQNKTYLQHNLQRCDSAYLPASTFKIINSLISLEEAAIAGIDDSIKWDGIDRNWAKWNQDHNMASAMQYSVVWFYQELARRVGREKMQFWLDTTTYGNSKIGESIDNFWLQGDIRISARQQIVFLEQLLYNQLPFKTENQKLVKQILLTDSTEQYKIYSKTGWAIRAKQQIGWLVGFVVNDSNTWIFACNIDIKEKSDTKYRKEIVYDILKSEHIIP